MSKTHGKFVWYDVMTSNPKTAESFYRSVIGWDVTNLNNLGHQLLPPSYGPNPAQLTSIAVSLPSVAASVPAPAKAR